MISIEKPSINLSKELVISIYEANKAKGFWKEELSLKELKTKRLLIASEIAEAVEAHRKESFLKKDLQIPLNENFVKDYLKGTYEEEIADVMIRLMDSLGAMCLFNKEITDEDFKLELDTFDDNLKIELESYEPQILLDTMLCEIYGEIIDTGNPNTKLEEVIEDLFGSYVFIFEVLERHLSNVLPEFLTSTEIINSKLAYNKSRTFLHGKSY